MLPAAGLFAQGKPFLRGDSNGDNGIDLSDGVNTLNYLFLGGDEPRCFDAVDANDDGDMDISDATFVLSYLFTGGAAPPAPGPNVPGLDPTADRIGCGPVPPAGDPRTFEPPESYRSTPAAPSRPPIPYLTEGGPVAGMHLFSGEAFIQAMDLAPNLRLKSVCSANPTQTRRWRVRNQRRLPVGFNRTFVEPVGHGWDVSTNIHLFADGEDMLLYNGDHRFDRFRKLATGQYGAIGIAAHATLDGKIFTVHFHSGGKWIFDLAQVKRKAGEGNPWLGDISIIEDPAGNEVTFIYDDSGRLKRVEEGGRHTPFHNAFMDSTYDANGLISTVTDHAGRQVRYGYYAEGESGGSPGDLKSVTTPAVTGTPNKNDFPDGKTVTFTYTTGFADQELNHNLLSITDATGNTFLRLEYSKGTDPSAVDYDRVTKRIWGDPHVEEDDGSRWEFFVYAPQTPSAENGGATMKTIVSGSSGEMREHLFDGRNLLVETREFTGRCDPNVPATETENRPKGKLRAADPDAFVTRYAWNDDQLPVSIQTPEGDLVTIRYLPPGAPNGSPSVQFNPKELSSTIRRGGQELTTVRSFEYDPATNALVRAVDALGRATRCEYDARGNLTRIIPPVETAVEEFSYSEFGQLVEHVHPPTADGRRRRDRFEYYGPAEGHQAGFLMRVVSIGASPNAAEPPVELEATFEYDQAGNLSSRRDVRGTVAWRHNQRGQVVQVEATYPVDGKDALVALRQLYYDANDLLVREDIANLDADGHPVPDNTHWSRISGFVKLHRLLRSRREVRAAQLELGAIEVPSARASAFETTELSYDAAGRLARIRFPDAVDGTEPNHTLDFRYDERGLVHERTKAGSRATLASTTRYSYNGNGDPTEVLEGLPGEPRTTRFEYDLLDRDRRLRAIDAHGNVTEERVDPVGRTIAVAHHGRLLDDVDQPAVEKPLLLARTVYEYDNLDRPIKEESDHVHHKLFGVTGQPTPVGDAKSTRRYAWSDASQLLSATDDNGNVTRFEHDGLGRLSKTIDAADNERLFSYDAASSVASILERDATVGSDGTTTFDELTTSFTYDSLGRPTAVADSTGRGTSCAYDARGLVVAARDALGNVERRYHDGACRQTTRERRMTEDGTGGSPVAGTIARTFDYDSAGRLAAVTDSNKHVTRYAYDALDRCVGISNADGTRGQLRYDRLDNLIETQDPNGAIVKMAPDLLGRMIRREYTTGAEPAVETSPDLFRYDGLSRLVRAENEGSIVTLEHDSLGNVVLETQNDRVVEADHDGESNLRRLVYPDKSEVLYEPDALQRIASVTEGGSQLAAFAFSGPDRLHQALYRGAFGTQVRYDAARRIEQVTHGIPGARPTVLERHVYQHNQTDLEFLRQRLVAGITQQVAWDSASRIVRSSSEGPPGLPPVAMDLRLDGEGNRLVVLGGLFPGEYFRDPTLPLPGDFQMNRYTKSPFDERKYDRNGALVESSSPSGKARLDYYVNGRVARLIQDPFSTEHSFRYDALGREISRKKTAPGQSIVEERTVYAGGSVIARSTDKVSRKLYYGGGGSGGRIAVRVEPTDGTGPVDLFPLDDGKGQAATLVDAKGDVLERYDVDAFGTLRIFDAQGSQIPASKFGYDEFAGDLRWDGETGLVHDPLSGKVYDPRSGKWLNAGAARGEPKQSSGGSMIRANFGGIRGHRDVGGYRTTLGMPLGSGPSGSTAGVMFNPKEYTITKSTPWKHHDIQGLDSPTLEFTSGDPYRMQFELFFDRYEEGKSVRTPSVGHGGGGGGGGLRTGGGGTWGSCFNCHPFGERAAVVGGLVPGGAILSSALASARGPRQSTSLDGSYSPETSRGLNPAGSRGIVGSDHAWGLRALHTAAHEAAHVVQQSPKVVVRGWNPEKKQEIAIDDLNIDAREMTTGLDVEYRLYGPGAAHWGQAKFTSACTLGGSKELQAWWQEVAKGKNIRKNITVNLFKSDKTPGRRYNLFECFPTRWSSGSFDTSSTVQTETLTVTVGRIELKS